MLLLALLSLTDFPGTPEELRVQDRNTVLGFPIH